MKQTSLVLWLILLPYAIIALVFSSGCANIIPPTGGPRDTLPPVLMLATPPQNSLHFTSNRITLVFDEYVDLNEPRKNLIVSPVPKSDPLALGKLKTVTIQIKDTLEPNTTYSLISGGPYETSTRGMCSKISPTCSPPVRI
jgi:hypothetical protein